MTNTTFETLFMCCSTDSRRIESLRRSYFRLELVVNGHGGSLCCVQLAPFAMTWPSPGGGAAASARAVAAVFLAELVMIFQQDKYRDSDRAVGAHCHRRFPGTLRRRRSGSPATAERFAQPVMRPATLERLRDERPKFERVLTTRTWGRWRSTVNPRARPCCATTTTRQDSATTSPTTSLTSAVSNFRSGWGRASTSTPSSSTRTRSSSMDSTDGTDPCRAGVGTGNNTTLDGFDHDSVASPQTRF